ncbi:hypothetical protein AUP68_17682 [Ilyonectria robusta]
MSARIHSGRTMAPCVHAAVVDDNELFVYVVIDVLMRLPAALLPPHPKLRIQMPHPRSMLRRGPRSTANNTCSITRSIELPTSWVMSLINVIRLRHKRHVCLTSGASLANTKQEQIG